MTEFPLTGGEFQNFKSFQTHNLETLLALPGVKGRIISALPVEWSQIKGWNPEQRCDPVGTQTLTTSGNTLSQQERF